ncbi:MAG: lytic murein transglycosylase [Sulfurovum sp.]|nr:lytic murein transglycosylase [Sulfurovum sp.]
MIKIVWVFLFLCLAMDAKDYTYNAKTIKTINILVKKHHFSRAEANRLFRHVKVQKTALRAFIPLKQQTRRKETRTPEQIAKAKKIRNKYGSWGRYARLTVNHRRTQQGIAFIQKHRKVFDAVQKQYGVPKEYIAAIIGIESAYGQNVGKYPVFDTLSTLAFEKNRRNKFFNNQLIKFLALSKTENFNPKNVYGSYAGAIGLCQFMPSNYLPYGVDFNRDGRISLQNPADAIASVANYFKKNGWRTGEPVAIRVSYAGTRFNRLKTGYKYSYHRKNLKGISPIYFWDYDKKVRLIKLQKKSYDELWYGAKNFFVITRYNHSSYYAMAVHQLAQKNKGIPIIYENICDYYRQKRKRWTLFRSH